MTREEWTTRAARLDALFGPPFGEDSEEAYFEILRIYPVEQVDLAITRALHERRGRGAGFAPSISELLGFLHREDHPIWVAARRLIRDALSRWHGQPGNLIGDLTMSDPMLGAFVEEYGVDDLHAVEWDHGAQDHYLNKLYDEYTEDWDRKEAKANATLRTSGDPEDERLLVQRVSRETLRRLDPGKWLEGPDD